MAAPLVEHVVADAAAFLKRVPLQEIGRNIYTLRDVVDEIKDKPTRRSLAFLPYQLIFKEPHPEHIRLVTEISKKTGDYPSLSATDIKVLALTYQLEVEHVGFQHLRKEPEVKVNIDSTQCRPEAPVNVAGFHFPSRKPADSLINRQTEKEAETSRPANHEEFNSFHFWRVPLPSLDEDLLSLLEPVDNKHKEADAQSHAAADDEEFNSFRFWRDPIQSVDDELLDSLKVGGVSESNSRTDRLQTEEGVEHKQAEEQSPDENKENEPEDGDDDDDEGGGWITASNITQVKMESADCMAPADVKVACLTTDFAMQNVLIQVGLHILSVSGMLIKQARNHILRCHACFRTTTNMAKVFCPHCGNKTLKKLAVTISEDGGMQMHFSRNPKVLNPRGLRYSLPLPQGGKHANNPHLVEDQRFPQQRLSRKARQKTDVFNPDYLAGASPFCENDIYSRAANLQIRDSQCGGGRWRANPNSARKKFVKKK